MTVETASPEDLTPSPTARSEIEEYTAMQHERRKVLPRAMLVGLFSGLVASLFRILLSLADSLRGTLLIVAHHYPAFGWAIPVVFAATGALISLALVRRLAPDAKGSGIPHLKAVQYRLREMGWQRLLPVKFFAGILALGSGLALGREGPTVQMGGAVGDAFADLFKAAPRERRTLIAAGAGAGLAAAFNAPLSGLTFVLEEVQRDFQPVVFAAALLACAVADVVARALTGPDPVFSIPFYAMPPLASLPAFALLGVAAGLTGVLFNRGLLGVLNWFARFSVRQRYLATGAVGAAVGLAGWWAPETIGSGHALAELAMSGRLASASLLGYFGLRLLLTWFSFGTGTAGGIFAPMLVLGAVLGLGIGQIGRALAPGLVTQPAVFAVVGMAAYFTAIVRAPLTGILLIVEMTGSYEQMLPLLVSCFCAYAVAEWLKELPVYEALLERDLAGSDSGLKMQEPIVVEVMVERGAPFDGRRVRDLGLPAGCVLLRVVESGREWVPTADTRLEAYMRLTAVIAPEASAGLDLLRAGCKENKINGTNR